MTRLIDADALLEAMKDNGTVSFSDTNEITKYVIYDEAKDLIINAPTIQREATPAESLQAFESVHYRDAILEVKRQIESNLVWAGMKYTYTPMPEFKQIRCIEAIDEALKEVK